MLREKSLEYNIHVANLFFLQDCDNFDGFEFLGVPVPPDHATASDISLFRSLLLCLPRTVLPRQNDRTQEVARCDN